MEDSSGMELLSRIQFRRREFRVIRRVRKMLGLQAEAVPVLVHLAAFSVIGAVKEITGVKLNSRLVRRNFQHAPGGRLHNSRCQRQLSTAPVQDEVMIVATSIFQLLI